MSLLVRARPFACRLVAVRQICRFEETTVNSAFRIVSLFLLSAFALSSGSATPPNRPQSDQNVQDIEVSAKKYEYSPSPIRVEAAPLEDQVHPPRPSPCQYPQKSG